MPQFETAESDALLAAIVSSSSDAILSKDLHGTITSWNAGAERILGYAATEVIGKSITMILPPDRLDEEPRTIARIKRGEPIEHYDTVRRHKDGTMRDMSVSMSPIRNTAGEIVGVSTVARDITAAVEAQERYRVALESIGDAVITTDVDGRVTYVNPVAEALTAWSERDAVGRPLAEVFHVLDEETRRSLDPATAFDAHGGSSLPAHLLLLGRDGDEHPVNQRASPILDQRGNRMGAVWVFHDVTAHRDAERAAARLAAIVRSSDDAIISKDLTGVVTTWNEGAERMFGFSAADMVGESITRIIPRERLQEEEEILTRLQRGDRVDHFSTIRVRKDGSPIRVSITISPIRDERGRIVGASKIARDITALYEANQALAAHARDLEATVRRRTKVLEEMVAELEGVSYSLSHDMRAPIRAIHSFAEIVLEEHGELLGQHGADNLRRVVSAAARLDRLIKDVLAFTRLARGDEVMTTVDVNALVHGLIHEMPDLQEPVATVSVDPLPAVTGHETLLSQCMANLLANATKFVRPGQKPDIRVYAEEEDGRVRLCVRDHGIGIDAEGQARLFTMFERLPTKDAYAGTGLGLAIVRKAAERMGGTVGVRSLPDQGSTFWIELPRAAA